MSFIILLVVVILFAILTRVVLSLPRFGMAPSGSRLNRIRHSSNYHNGQFHNIEHTPSLAEGESYIGVFWKFFFNRSSDNVPKHTIPSARVDLGALSTASPFYVWFGHSSYLTVVDGISILVDPVLSGYASPFSFTTRAFKGTDAYNYNDIPNVDVLLLTHDHWDHLDVNTIEAIHTKARRIICSLGVGAHLVRWGIAEERITELVWGEHTPLSDMTMMHCVPSRHFSGRTFKRNQTLWSAFVIKSTSTSVYLGGDSGYGHHFKQTGDEFGPFDLAILENGQYNASWRYIHMLPPEVLKAANDLRAANVIPVHSCKFALSVHPWYEPLEELTKHHEANGGSVILHTPIIGQPLFTDATSLSAFVTPRWWRPLMPSLLQ